MSNDGTSSLLRYGRALRPKVFYAGSTLAEVQILVQIPGDVACGKLVFQFPVGTGKESLFTSATWKSVLGIAPTTGGWKLEKDPKVEGRFTATTSSEPKGDFTFGFKQITVHDRHGVATIAITENSAKTGNTATDRPAKVQVEKVSTAVKFTNLRTDPADVACGNPVTVKWEGSSTAEYTVYYNTDDTAPAPQLKDGTWSTTVQNVTYPTTFVVRAQSVEGNQTLHNYQSIHATVRRPKVVTGDLAVQTSAQLFGTPVTYPQDWGKGAFVAVAQTDGLLLYQPTFSVQGHRTCRVFLNVFTDAQLSHTQRRTVRNSAEKPKTPAALCVPVPAGSKIELTALMVPDNGSLTWIPLGGKGLTVSKQEIGEAVPASGSAPRLMYAYAPRDVEVSTATQPSKVTFNLHVDTADTNEKLSKLTITLPLGTGKGHLTESLDGISTLYTRWSSFDKIDDTHYEADPGQELIFRQTPENLTLQDVTVNKATGTAEIEIREERDGSQSTPVKLRVLKGAPELKMRGLRAQPPTVRRGGRARITWQAVSLSNVRYELVWDDKKANVSTVNEYTIDKLYRTTPVTLTAYDTAQQNKVLHSLSTTVTVSEPDLTVKTLKVAGTCTILGKRQVWSPSFTSTWQGRAEADGLLVLSAINRRPGRSLSGDVEGAGVRAKNEPVTLQVDVTPKGGTAYRARSLAYDPKEEYGDLLPVGIVVPVARDATVAVKREPGSTHAIDTLLTWLPFGAGEMGEGAGPQEEESLALATVVAPRQEDDAVRSAGDGMRRRISGFRPDSLQVPNGGSVTLSWTADPSTTLTLVYSDAREATVTENVTGTTEHTVRGLTKDTAFALIASEGPYGTGRMLEVAATTVTSANPNADFTELHVTGRMTVIGPPEKVGYGFTQPWTKSNTASDGFLVGYISDDSTSGSKVTAKVTPATGSSYEVSLYSAKSADGTQTVPDAVFLPVPKGATLTIAAASAHPSGEAVEHSTSRTASLVWIPLGGRAN
ncbi:MULTISPECIES: hypothetical protein [Streptomyces]|uniref:hypothetical protein n=1 Tax=Streptomyces TaxID=1883 RepID=UPI00163C9647|nr:MULTISPECIES: hypothetical protein [Streptomyces]MBC2877500.1 hypothetical protein [Streptomyces sp. TYQ1024]UBI36255.1 hypothetical protein K7I03_07140 [Streptomyces mobaraensis]UKW28849.1 hypothetical protein MCU78_07125 [Streptomyces sp. TYQ1024]